MKYEPIKRTIKNKTEKRVSRKTVELLQNHLQEEAEKMAEEAASLTEHAGRKTIQPKDMEKALEQR